MPKRSVGSLLRGNEKRLKKESKEINSKKAKHFIISYVEVFKIQLRGLQISQRKKKLHLYIDLVKPKGGAPGTIRSKHR